MYLPPPGFIEVTKDNQDTKVSPHFTLKQFLCKEDTTRPFPKYVVLKERLPLKLEAMLERVNELGVKVDTLHVMSAYRTPYYNHAIGDVKYSMHQWGSAADVYVDPHKKNRMEDLNRDGRVDIEDAKFLYDDIERMLAAKELPKFQGGMGYLSGDVRASAVRARRRPRHRGAVERIEVSSEVQSSAVRRCVRRRRWLLRCCSVAARGAAPIRCWRTRRTSTRCGTRAIRPLLAGGFRGRRATELQKARAYAYGGSVIQDLGYYPFGSRFFSNLLHYVRTGDFVEAMIREAQDVERVRLRARRAGALRGRQRRPSRRRSTARWR